MSGPRLARSWAGTVGRFGWSEGVYPKTAVSTARGAPCGVAPVGASEPMGSARHLGHVDNQVVGKPAVPGAERLGSSCLGAPRYAEPVVVWLEAHDSVVAHPELLPSAGEVQVLGREAQEASVGVDRLLPLGMGRL